MAILQQKPQRKPTRGQPLFGLPALSDWQQQTQPLNNPWLKKRQKETNPALLKVQYLFREGGSQPQRQPTLLSHIDTRQSGQLTICRRAEMLFNSTPGSECLLCAHRWVHARPGALAPHGRAMEKTHQDMGTAARRQCHSLGTCCFLPAIPR